VAYLLIRDLLVDYAGVLHGVQTITQFSKEFCQNDRRESRSRNAREVEANLRWMLGNQVIADGISETERGEILGDVLMYLVGRVGVETAYRRLWLAEDEALRAG